jgi:uncharacterized integral membrane protein (TIGR00698 family)
VTDWLKRHAPGILLCVAITIAATLVERLEVAITGSRYLEALVIAILIGVAVRAYWTPGEAWKPGIAFSAKTLLEIAVVLLGASISAATVWALGPFLLVGIATVVAVALATTYAICRALGLPLKMAILIACGNSICGNSAIVAVAPVIDARKEEVAAALAFTAVLGIAIVVGLPLAQAYLGLSIPQYGAMAGLTVYAVPQVLAAAAPAGLVAMQAGTLVKLLRVLMLGPVILVLGFLERRRSGAPTKRSAVLLPWFIVGFVVLATVRSLGLMPESLLGIPPVLASGLTVVAMAGLGLSVDIRAIAAAGGRVIVAASLSLAALLGVSYLAILTLPANAFG